MRLIYTKHAQRRMHQRGITRDEVADVLTSVARTSVPGDAAAVCYIGTTVGRRRLKVCVSRYIEDMPPDGELIVVTVYDY